MDNFDLIAAQGLREKLKGGVFAEEVNAAGTLTIATPPAGKRIRVAWAQILPAGQNTADNLVTIAFSGGSRLYRTFACSHWQVFIGGVDEALLATIENAARTTINIHYDFI